MRASVAGLLLAAAVLPACTASTLEPAEAEEVPPAPPPAEVPSEDRPATLVSPEEPGPSEEPSASVFAEVVYVFQTGHDGSKWMCTGTLVSKHTVVTAAHCIDPARFGGFEIVAPLAPNAPRRSASNPAMFGGHYDDVANPDIGILTLDEPLALPRYAELTDVVGRVEGGEELSAAAIVRTDEVPMAPLQCSEILPLSSAVRFGYEHGYSTPMFSKGGDSGAGLFLVEDGKPTHKLIGVARQPEPDRGIDHFTRIGESFQQWFTARVKADPK